MGAPVVKYFRDPGAFAAFIPELIVAVQRAGPMGVAAGARIIETEAKREIGHYQDAAGPFAAWAELADATKADRVRQGYPENNPLLRSGDLLHSIGVRTEGTTASIGSDDPIAEYQELGTMGHRSGPDGLPADAATGSYPGIPPRSFLGGAAFRMEDRVVEAVVGHVVWALRGLGPRND